MPSNQTQNYQLSQWSKDDQVKMEDFNADNAKIDAALAAMPYVKIVERTVSTAARQVNISVAGIGSTGPKDSCLGTLYNGVGFVSFITPRANRPVTCVFFSTDDSSGHNSTSGSQTVTWSNLSTLNFISTTSSILIPAGSKVILCGVKK